MPNVWLMVRLPALRLCAGHDQAHLQSLDAQLDYERDMQHHFCDQPVFAEGVRAFIEKRKPDFRTVETAQIKAEREKR